METGVYGVFSTIDGGCLYVGMTADSFSNRWAAHRKDLASRKHIRIEFADWFHTNGGIQDLLEFRVLEEAPADHEVLNRLEIKWFNLLEPAFWGKRPSENENWSHSESTRSKIGASTTKSHEAKLKARGWDGTRLESGAPGVKLTCSLDSCAVQFATYFKLRNEARYCSTACASIGKQVPLSDEMLVQLYCVEMLSTHEIGALLKVPQQSILRQLGRLNIPRRKNSFRRKEEEILMIKCVVCEAQYETKSSRSKTCSRSCRGKLAMKTKIA